MVRFRHKKMVITRFAPSPTMTPDSPVPHLGFFRTLYHNWLFAKSQNGQFIVRIDDTDLKRSNTDNIKLILDVIHHVNLDYDGLYMQSDRFEIYFDKALDLINQGLAIHDDGCIRLDVDKVTGLYNDSKIVDHDNPVRILGSWVENVGRKKLGRDIVHDMIDSCMNQVLIKSDGSPTYNFATVVDDHLLNISDVIRGTDHISNTYKQAVIYDLFGWNHPNFHHVGLVCNTSGAKLSKRESDDLNLMDYDPDALLAYVLKLAWSPNIDNKANDILDRDRALQMFINDGKFRSANCKLDLKKLNHYQRKFSHD